MHSSDPTYYKAYKNLNSGTTYRVSRTAKVRALQVQQGLDPCFLTEKRLLCRDESCEWKQECRRLVAAWKR